MLVGERDSGLRLAELVAVFSLAMDLGMGQPMEHVLRSWLIATRLGDHLGVAPDRSRDRAVPRHRASPQPSRRRWRIGSATTLPTGATVTGST